MLRRICLLVFVGLASLTSDASAQITWTEYRPAGIGFALDMPGPWRTEVRDIQTAVGAMKGYVAGVEVGDHFYMSMYIAYPPESLKGRPVTPLLDNARNRAVANVKGTLRKEEQLTVGGYPARQIIVEAPSDLVAVQKFFVLGATLVQAVVVGHNGVDNEPNTKRFLESMKVVPP